jgi:hypothetical protein
MQESHEKKIRQNIYSLVEVTTSLEELLEILRKKNVLTEEDQAEIVSSHMLYSPHEVHEIKHNYELQEKADSLFDRKSQLFWVITKKDDSAFVALIEAFKALGNEKGVELLTQETQSSPVLETGDQEGVNLAEDMEKEFDRIQSQAESDTEPEKDSSGIQVTEEVLKREEIPVEASGQVPQIKEMEQLEDEIESDVRVEVTPPESDPEMEEVAATASALAEEHKAKEEVVVEEVKAEVEVVVVEKTEEVKQPQSAGKQVSFQTPKEFVINKKNEPESESSRDDELKPVGGKSLVAQNRELFEKNAPKGVNVRYSFKKEEAVPDAAEKKVANLKNFFQNLSSGTKDDSNAGSDGTYNTVVSTTFVP